MSGFSIDARPNIKRLLAIANAWTATQTYNDDVLLRWGTDGDTGSLNRSTALTANTALTGILEGTPVTPVAIAANSFIVGNITNDGDILLAVSKAGTSYMAFMADASTGDTLLGVPTGQSVDVYVAGTKVLDVAANLALYEAAASTANQVLTVSNTSNAAAASHAIVEAQVGGTTSTGDPQYRLTIPGGTSFYIGLDNNVNDNLLFGTGTTVGSSIALRIIGDLTGAQSTITGIDVVPRAITLADAATNLASGMWVRAFTATAPNTTTPKTALWPTVQIQSQTIAQSGGAMTVNKATGLEASPLIAGTSVTLTHNSAFRALNAAQTGTTTNLSGLFVEALTGGATQNIQLLLANGSTEPTAAPTDTAGIYAIDVGAASVLGFVEETAVVTPAGDFALTNKWIVRINGTTYAIGLTTVLT